MNKWQKEREEQEAREDRASILTLPRLLTRVVFFGALIGFLLWWPWTLGPRLLVCAGGLLGYLIVARSTALGRQM
jgi:hypothetical protein